MKFSTTLFDKDEFFKNIQILLEDKNCIIFIDTNIFALLFKLYSSARNEFFEWASPLIDSGRIKTPVWALNEYTNRAIRNKTSDYFSPLKKINTSQKDFNELYGFLKMNVDEASLKNTTYKNREEYIADLDIIVDKLSKVKVLAKNKESDYIDHIHDEIQSKFEKTILDSDIFEILKETKIQGDFRFSHKIPPGFEDEIKDLNSYGDLIIWTEIINYCKLNKYTKAIILTNDNKKDWVYAPSRIIENLKTIPNRAPEFKIIDPRLVYEFKLKTGSEELHLINFETLSKLLVKKTPSKSLNLAVAFQIASEQEELIDESESLSFLESMAELAPDVNQKLETANTDSTTFTFSENALRDFYFAINNSVFSNLLFQLKSYSWNHQNNAVDQLSEIQFNFLEETQELKDDLFIIGRNIYQAACGRAFSAINFLDNLHRHLTYYSDFVSNNLYSGILFEIYFDNKGKFRKNELKTAYINEVFAVSELLKIKPSIEFIIEKLSPFKDELIYYPSLPTKVYEIEVEFKIFEVEIHGSYSEIQQIEKIRYNNKDLLVDDPLPFGGNSYSNREEFEYGISLALAIPKEYARFRYKSDFNDDLGIKIKDGLMVYSLNKVF